MNTKVVVRCEAMGQTMHLVLLRDANLPYIGYYKSTGFTQEKAEVFYYFKINVAPAESIYLMTE